MRSYRLRDAVARILRTGTCLTLALLSCVPLACSGGFFSSRTTAIGHRSEGPGKDWHEILITQTTFILKTNVQTCSLGACDEEQGCYTEDLWWTVELDQLTRGPEPTLAAGSLHRGHFPDALRDQSQPLPSARSLDGVRYVERPDDACLYKILEPNSFYPGSTIASECNGPKKLLHVPSLSVPIREYHTWWSYPMVTVLLPPALVVDVVTAPIQLGIGLHTRSGVTLGCPRGDW